MHAVLESSQFILGKTVERFEARFAEYCESPYAIGVNSGTSALHLALLAAGVGAGDEVITVPFTFIATVAAIRYAGATPVFVDIDPRTFTMDARGLEAAVTPKTRAILPVHLYGQPAHMDPIVDFARTRGLVVIEDAAQAHGARYRGRRVGSIGGLACFSFYPSKNLGACGEGGAVVTSNPEFARKIRMLRDWGQESKYRHVLPGFNYRLEALQGAALGVKLPYLDGWNARRAMAAECYSKFLEGSEVRAPELARDRTHVFHVYAVRCQNRGSLQSRLASEGIQTGIHYPVPVHLTPAHADLGYSAGDFPESERAASEVLSLPMFPELSEVQIRTVADAVRAAAGVAEPELCGIEA